MTTPLTIPEAGAGRNQTMRTAVALAAVTGRSVQFNNLVDDRLKPRPGLGPGGQTVLAAAARLSNGRYQQSEDGKSALFTPGVIQAGDYSFDVAKTRPSSFPLTLVALALTPMLCRGGGECRVIFSGATHVQEGPSSEQMRQVFLPMLGEIGIAVHYREIAPGFFPAGRGEAEYKVRPAGVLRSLEAEFPFRPKRVGVSVLVSGLPVYLAEQALEGATERLSLKGIAPETDLRRARGGKGMALTVWADDGPLRASFTAYGKQGGRPESLAVEAAEYLGSFLQRGAAMPAEQATHLVLPLALAQGTSRFTVGGNLGSLKAAARAVNAFWPGTVRLEHAKTPDLAAVRIMGREWGKLAD